MEIRDNVLCSFDQAEELLREGKFDLYYRAFFDKEGKLHRLDGPAFEYADGDKYWYQNGLRHRLDGPAIEYFNGEKHWYQNGKLHRLDGPAIEYVNGDNLWYQNGKLHRLDGPAVEWANDTAEWYHRLGGPAIEWANGTKHWYQNGEHINTVLPDKPNEPSWKDWFFGILKVFTGPFPKIRKRIKFDYKSYQPCFKKVADDGSEIFLACLIPL